MKHHCRSAACEHRVMITDSINHCQPQLILSYLFLFCSIQVSRNIWQPSSLGRAKDQTVLLFIDSKAPPAQPQSLLVPAAGSQLQPEAAVLHFGAFWSLAGEVSYCRPWGTEENSDPQGAKAAQEFYSEVLLRKYPGVKP